MKIWLEGPKKNIHNVHHRKINLNQKLLDIGDESDELIWRYSLLSFFDK